jgi:hypothetical protein
MYPESDLNGQAGLLEEDPRCYSFWRTKDGQRVRVADMADSHVLNTIRVLRGFSPHGTTVKLDDVERRRWLNVMANEVYRRGLTIDGIREKDPVHE